MKKIFRITETELRGLVNESIQRVLREHKEQKMLLQMVAQGIVSNGNLECTNGENETEVVLGEDEIAYITYEVSSSPYIKRGESRMSTYDIPEEDEIVDDIEIQVLSILYCVDGECTNLDDDGLVKTALENAIEMSYDTTSIPTEDEYFYHED